MKVLAIAGSLRAASSNVAVLGAARDLAPAGMQLELTTAHHALPAYAPEGPLPDSVAAWRALIAAADGVVISSPEYAHGIPGALKNALDWLIDAPAIADKPILLIGASPSAAEHSHPQLLAVVRSLSRRVLDGGAHPFSQSKLDAAGKVTTPALLTALARGLAQLAEAAAAATHAASSAR